MKLALIPPYSEMSRILRTNYQLVLPEHLGNAEYQHAYIEARKNGDYLILDNGAAEGTLLSHGELRSMGLGLMVNEIVVPDVLGNMDDTLQLTKDFFRFGTDLRFKYMGVVQGKSFGECCACIEAYVDGFPGITVFGIPRHLITTVEDDDIRSNLSLYIKRTHPEYQVHLLGTNPTYIRELKDFQHQFHVAGVRGVDTSAPFNYAYHGKSILEGDVAGRPDNYFDVKVPSQTTAYGIELLKTWTNG